MFARCPEMPHRGGHTGSGQEGPTSQDVAGDFARFQVKVAPLPSSPPTADVTLRLISLTPLKCVSNVGGVMDSCC